jgi:ClpP class serine protease
MNDEKDDMPHDSFENLSFLMTGRFEIQREYAVEQLSLYLENLRVLSVGVPYEKLNIENLREKFSAKVISVQSGLPRTIGDSTMLNDTALTPRNSIAHLQLSGTMRSSDFWCNRGVDSLVADINAAYQNSNISGIIIEANTGGGESIAGQMLNGALAEAPKPVVVWAHYLASAGIMGTLPVSEVIASTRAASFGSIGTFVSVNKRMAQWYAQSYTDVYASKSTNKNRPFRALQKGDLSAIQEMVDVSNESFLQEVQAYRSLNGTQSDIAHTLSGEMFQAGEAKARGLIDGIGGFQYAIRRVMAYAGQ